MPPVLVDQPQLGERGGQVSAADGQVLTRLLPQPGDLLGDAVPGQPGIALDAPLPAEVRVPSSDTPIE